MASLNLPLANSFVPEPGSSLYSFNTFPVEGKEEIRQTLGKKKIAETRLDIFGQEKDLLLSLLFRVRNDNFSLPEINILTLDAEEFTKIGGGGTGLIWASFFCDWLKTLKIF